MIIHEIKSKLSDITKDLILSFQEKGAENFLSSPDCIKKALKISDHDIQELDLERISLCKQKNWDGALEVLQYLSFFEPLNPSHQLLSGVVLHQMQRFQEAIKILSLGLLFDSENPKFYFYLGICHKALKEKAKAKESLETCCELSKNHPEYKELFFLAKEALNS